MIKCWTTVADLSNLMISICNAPCRSAELREKKGKQRSKCPKSTCISNIGRMANSSTITTLPRRSFVNNLNGWGFYESTWTENRSAEDPSFSMMFPKIHFHKISISKISNSSQWMSLSIIDLLENPSPVRVRALLQQTLLISTKVQNSSFLRMTQLRGCVGTSKRHATYS